MGTIGEPPKTLGLVPAKPPMDRLARHVEPVQRHELGAVWGPGGIVQAELRRSKGAGGPGFWLNKMYPGGAVALQPCKGDLILDHGWSRQPFGSSLAEDPKQPVREEHIKTEGQAGHDGHAEESDD